jgi:hypothetical protein
VNAVVPAALALFGTALMAVAVFGRFRRPAEPLLLAPARPAPALPPEPAAAGWPLLLGAQPGACDAAARIDLAEALGAVASPWSEAVLREAYEAESDGAVRAAIAAALSSTQSLVT